MVGMLTKSKILKLAHCLLKDNGITVAIKIKPTMLLLGELLLILC